MKNILKNYNNKCTQKNIFIIAQHTYYHFPFLYFLFINFVCGSMFRVHVVCMQLEIRGSRSALQKWVKSILLEGNRYKILFLLESPINILVLKHFYFYFYFYNNRGNLLIKLVTLNVKLAKQRNIGLYIEKKKLVKEIKS